MNATAILIDAFGRVKERVHSVVSGLTPEDLAYRIDLDANTIGWLIWHLARIQDDHLADVAQIEQLWIRDGWADRFDLPFERTSTGYGHSSADVASVLVSSGQLLTGYYDAVHEQTIAYVSELADTDYDLIVDTSWDPPVTLGVRLVSVVSDDLQHVGQAAFIRGVLERTR